MVKRVLIFTGPTATGKSNTAIEVAKNLKGEIINGDSKQIYKEFKILTAHPDSNSEITHHMYGHVDIQEHYSVHKWIQEVKHKIEQIHSKEKIAIIVGGTGLYINSLIYGISNIPKISSQIKQEVKDKFHKMDNNELYEQFKIIDPIGADKIKENDRYRILRNIEIVFETGKPIYEFQKTKTVQLNPDYNISKYLLIMERENIYNNINKRFEMMLKNGAIDEVNNIMNIYDQMSYSAQSIIGLSEIMKYLKEEITFNEMKELAQRNTRRYAKKQLTWFNNQCNEFHKIFLDKEDILDKITRNII